MYFLGLMDATGPESPVSMLLRRSATCFLGSDIYSCSPARILGLELARNGVKMGHMVIKTGQRGAHIMHVPFASATPDFGFEALELSEVLKRVGADHFARPRRAEFFQVMTLKSGSAHL